MIASRHHRALAFLALAATALGTWRMITRPHNPELPPSDLSPITLRLNPNTATLDELLSIPGMGSARATALISHRTSQIADGIPTPYQSPQDLSKIRGFGPSSLSRITPHLLFPTQ